MRVMQLTISGMTCERCAGVLQQLIEGFIGIETCAVDFATCQAWVWYDPHTSDLAHLRRHIESAGFQAEPIISPGSLACQGRSLTFNRQSQRVLG